MKGYKGTDKNMRCRNMQYEIGKTFETTGKPILCENGYHFCLNLSDVFHYYDFDEDNRYFEVEAKDDVTVIGDDKCVTTRIRFVRELSSKEVNRAIYGNGYGSGRKLIYARDTRGDGSRYGYGCGNGDGYGDGSEYGDGWGNGYKRRFIYKDVKELGNGNGYKSINEFLIWR